VSARLLTALLLVAGAAPASAQIDPLLFLKGAQPNVILMIDTSERMQRDAPSDPSTVATSNATSNYYDPLIYARGGDAANPWEPILGVNDTNTSATGTYRRRFNNLTYIAGADAATATRIDVVGDRDAGYSRFEAPTRLALARAAIHKALRDHIGVARFGLYQTRQRNPVVAAGKTLVTSAEQRSQTDGGSSWKMARGKVDGANGANPPNNSELAAPGTSNASILDILARDPRGVAPGIPAGRFLLPAGLDDATSVDSPVRSMVDDMKAAAFQPALADLASCRNTVAVLVTGGGEGTTSGSADPVAPAVSFLFNGLGRRVPIIVVAIAPPLDQVAQLTSIASASGGQYFQVTKTQIDAALESTAQANASAVAGTVLVPELVRAVNIGIQTAFQAFEDINSKSLWSSPWTGWKGYAGSAKIPSSEFQATSPVIGTVDLNDARDLLGSALAGPQPRDVRDKAGEEIPQRSNLLITSGFVLPGFDGIMRGFRLYRPVADSTQTSGYRFQADGTPLWIAAAPADSSGASAGPLYKGDRRNLYTALPDGTIVALKAASAAQLAPQMNLSASDAEAVITDVRAMPLGAVIDSTPSIMNPPSLDPPPDAAYPAFSKLHEKRRSIVWVGTNRGILAALDARTGVEVWGFVPPNLLPKLTSLREGQTIGAFKYFMDASPRISDVLVPGKCDDAHPELCWRTHLIVGQGPGGTFYQSFDVTLDGLDTVVAPDSNDVASLLAFFSNPSRITLNWSFPGYSHFDPKIAPFGDLDATTATAIERSVGQTWSDPAVGQIAGSSGPYSVLVGSGFLPYETQQQANRRGAVAGTTFYILNAKDGTVYASMDVGSDGINETSSDCRQDTNGCRQLKNALQTDPVATGRGDQHFITRAYLGDLDGAVWKFDITLDASSNPAIATRTRIFPSAAGNGDQPILSSMATVNVAGLNQYVFFGTGSDLLPSTDASTVYHLLAINDNGTVPAPKTFDVALAKTASRDKDEKVTAFPTVAGDIVFFATTTFDTSSNASAACTAPTANLYALTFLGGPAYDTNADNLFDGSDSVKVASIAGGRATAPFVADQHLVLGVGGRISVFGDPADFNNGVGNAGVRILSWREVR
jgi:hypothetical protein